MKITTQFEPGEIVTHVVDEAVRGVVVAFMARGTNHSYQVQWGVEKDLWHQDFELRKLDQPRVDIGFWRREP